MVDVTTRVQDAMDRLVGSGAERGIQVAAYRHGELLLEAVAGVADATTGRVVTADTPFYNFSIGKGATSAVVHVLAERGALDYEAPVTRYWPEFAAQGKDHVTVRHVLTHSAGVPGVPLDTTIEDLCDWAGICAAIAAEKLWWEPGTQVGYHAYTFGYILGEVVRRVTGQPISRVLRDEVAGPLGVADELYFGMPVAEQPRLARLEDPDGPPFDSSTPPAGSPMLKAGPVELTPDAALGNRTDVLAADIPSAAKTSARAIARLYAALLGEVDGFRLIPAERLREVTAVAASGTDQVYGNPSTWGLGFSLGGLGEGGPSAQTIFGMAGAGGSYACGDTATGLAYAITKNRLTPDFSVVTEIGQLIRDSIL